MLNTPCTYRKGATIKHTLMQLEAQTKLSPVCGYAYRIVVMLPTITRDEIHVSTFPV